MNNKRTDSILTPIELRVLLDASQITQEFIREAIKKWDGYGEGHFADFIKDYVNSKWEDYVIGN